MIKALVAASLLAVSCQGFSVMMSMTTRREVLHGAGTAAAALTLAPTPSIAASPSPLPEDAYCTLGGEMPCCRVLNGMWQLSGAHGFKPEAKLALQAMTKLQKAGLSTFDAADHYGPAETILGSFKEESPALAANSQLFTKWVPRPGPMARPAVEAAIDRSLSRMQTDRLDLLQFHWWMYSDPAYLDALNHMQDLVAEKKIRHLALTNFDTKHLEICLDKGIDLVSNQVQYSLIDQRPKQRMQQLCQERDVKLLGYGSLLGGFLTDKWLGKPAPTRGDLTTASEGKYINMIYQWGKGDVPYWEKFQTLLQACRSVADKHSVSIANVAVRWLIEQPAVGGAIVGARLGYTDHINDTTKVFSFKLDGEDMGVLQAASRGNNLMEVIGDCGDEYRA
ncbi:unnamed protein product [Chrysoparadoxa australica]